MVVASFKHDVFISYRHRQHADIVDRVRQSLEDRQLTVWLDKAGGVPRSSWGVFLPLLNGLRHSKAVVFLVPELSDSNGTLIASSTDRWLDALKQYCVWPIEQVIAWWHRTIYEIELCKRADESWQDWERRVALATQIPLFWSVRVDRQGADTKDVERAVNSLQPGRFKDVKRRSRPQRSVKSPTRAHNSLQQADVVARTEHLAQDLVPHVEQGLTQSTKRGREIAMKPNQSTKFVAFLGGLVVVILVVFVLGVLSFVLESVKTVLAWPFVRAWELVGKAQARFTRR